MMVKEMPIQHNEPGTSKRKATKPFTIQPIKVLLMEDATKFNDCLNP